MSASYNYGPDTAFLYGNADQQLPFGTPTLDEPEEPATVETIVAVASAETETGPIVRYPESIADARRRITKQDIGQHAAQDREPTPHEELGGGITQTDKTDESKARPLDSVIRGCEEWMTTIFEAVEKMGLNEITAHHFADMPVKQHKKDYARAFYRFNQRLLGERNRLLASEFDIDRDSTGLICESYGTKKSKQELESYSERLTELIAHIETSGMNRAIKEHLIDEKLLKRVLDREGKLKRHNLMNNTKPVQAYFQRVNRSDRSSPAPDRYKLRCEKLSE